MLLLLSRVVQSAVLALVAYDTALASAGWSTRPPAPAGRRQRRFRVLVPAHDEGHVLPGVLRDLTDQDYQRERVRLVVLADGCSDDTVQVAQAHGVVVDARDEPSGSKGRVLAWHLARHPLQSDEALVVLDADTRVPPDLLACFSDELEAGGVALQANLDVLEPGRSWLASASALSYWSGNRMVQLARSNLGMSCDLGGTGMCLTPEALAVGGGFGQSMSEDRELALTLVLSGRRVRWLHAVRIYDEKPDDLGVALRQRARWRNGLDQVRRSHLVPLLRVALRDRSPAAADFALRQVRPSRASLVVLSGAACAAATLRVPGALPARVWSAALGAQLLLPVVFLVRDDRPLRLVARYPLVVVYGLTTLPVRLMALRRAGWVHTPHTGARGKAATPGMFS